MPNYRRAHTPGGTYFFTLVTNQRRPIFGSEAARKTLGDCLRETKQRWPFEINAIVLLPDHLHLICTLPRGDDRYSVRLSWMKKEFTKRWLQGNGSEGSISIGRRQERRRGVWQPRFWEHTIENEKDFERHFDYVHFNPVKHEYVRCPHEWRYSSFHRWVKAGVYLWHWGCWNENRKPLDFTDIEDHVGE